MRASVCGLNTADSTTSPATTPTVTTVTAVYKNGSRRQLAKLPAQACLTVYRSPNGDCTVHTADARLNEAACFEIRLPNQVSLVVANTAYICAWPPVVAGPNVTNELTDVIGYTGAGSVCGDGSSEEFTSDESDGDVDGAVHDGVAPKTTASTAALVRPTSAADEGDAERDGAISDNDEREDDDGDNGDDKDNDADDSEDDDSSGDEGGHDSDEDFAASLESDADSDDESYESEDNGDDDDDDDDEDDDDNDDESDDDDSDD